MPVERAYYEKTKIFPIMHVVVIRRDVYERNRWVAMALYKAFVASAADHVCATCAQPLRCKTMLPWSSA